MKRAFLLLFTVLPCFAAAQDPGKKFEYAGAIGSSFHYTNLNALPDTVVVPEGIGAGLSFLAGYGQRDAWTFGISGECGRLTKKAPAYYWLQLGLEVSRGIYVRERFGFSAYTGAGTFYSELHTRPADPVVTGEYVYVLSRPVVVNAGVKLEYLLKTNTAHPYGLALCLGTTIPVSKTRGALNRREFANAPDAWLLPVGATLLFTFY